MTPDRVTSRSTAALLLRLCGYVCVIVFVLNANSHIRAYRDREFVNFESGKPNSAPQQKARHPLADLKDRVAGIPIVPRSEPGMFPKSWYDPTSPTTATDPDPSLVPLAVAGIESALRKYPDRLLKENLRKIYVVDNLQVDGVPSGGVNAPEFRTLYVDLDNLERSEVKAWAEETVHHELAHMLADNHPLLYSADAWTKLNPVGFKYGDGGTEAIRHGMDGDAITDEYWRQGFVEQYSMSDPDEDFATLCERLLSGDRNVVKAADRYPTLKRKEQAVFEFYHQLDPAFTEDYIRGLKSSSK